MERKYITGVILAGGKSRRMGREKGLVELHQKPLIEYSLDVFRQVCGNILISSNSRAYDRYPYEIVPDLIPDSGPMGGIYSCLMRSQTDYNLVLSCDTPFVGPELFELLLSHAGGRDCVVPWHGGEHYEPLCSFYHKRVTLTFYEFIRKGNFKIPDLLRQVDTLPLKMNASLDFYQEDYFFNINSPEQLRKADKK